MKEFRNSAFGLALIIGTPTLAFAQTINLKGPAQQLASEIKGIFPYVAVAIFVVVVLVNLGHFVKDNGDWKKGLTNIVLFALILGFVVGLINYVGNIKLN
ncbi:hypothetical protein D1631_00085 [Chryseobacterium nematophagum]|uniref:DUF4134 domain-containing protein n=1 Tax=Chryseobacterium nematophagum TaxID=2305228 RepID=A0A3M7TLA1_9FLAO|nr:hypothetical protein [Chryseobacterium nematophagum]RNA63944.1 hypothetical protein D1631_00085 [Chryseobacterium nematophagum]